MAAIHWHELASMGLAASEKRSGRVRPTAHGARPIHWHEFATIDQTAADEAVAKARGPLTSRIVAPEAERLANELLRHPGGLPSGGTPIYPRDIRTSASSSAFAPVRPPLRPLRLRRRGRAVKLFQMTGDFDPHYQLPTRSRTGWDANVGGTDLGIPVRHRGARGDRIYFFFGDTAVADIGRAPRAQGPGEIETLDSYAWTDTKQDVFTVPPWLRFFKESVPLGPNRDAVWTTAYGEGFRPLRVQGTTATYGAFCVPTGAVSIEDKLFLFFVADATSPADGPVQLKRTILCVSEDEGNSFQYLHDIRSDRFRQLTASLAPGEWVGLHEPVVLIWGTSSQYRHSSVYLAYCPVSEFGTNPDAWQYLSYVDYSSGSPGQPKWSHRDVDAMALSQHDRVGELSVAFDEGTGLWLLSISNDFGWPPSLLLLYAPTPWGPWGTTDMKAPNGTAERLVMSFLPQTYLYDAVGDSGYGNILHAGIAANLGNAPIVPCASAYGAAPPRSFDAMGNDLLSDFFAGWGANMLYRVGGPYGGYLVEPWFRRRSSSDDVTELDVVFTLSTWNPYQVTLMFTPLLVELADNPTILLRG